MFRGLVHLLEYLFRRRRLEDDLDEELRSSFEMMVDQFVARGMPLAEARRAAQLEFEGLDQVKEKVRDGLVGSAVQGFLQDARYAWRGLRRRPSLALIALWSPRRRLWRSNLRAGSSRDSKRGERIYGCGICRVR